MCPIMAVFDLSIGLLQLAISIVEYKLLGEKGVDRVILWRCRTCQLASSLEG